QRVERSGGQLGNRGVPRVATWPVPDRPRSHGYEGAPVDPRRAARLRRGGGARGSRPHHPALSATDPLLAAAARGPGPLMNTSRWPSLAAAVLTAAFMSVGGAARRHVGIVPNDALNGCWFSVAGSGSPSGSFTSAWTSTP